MSNGDSPAAIQPVNHGWQVTFTAMGINLALGILYTWSVLSKGIPEAWGWGEAEKSLPYAVACLVFSLVMVPAGRMQDKLGPRLTATIGGILVGVGMILASFSTQPLGYILGFGVLAGAGIGFGYASATPPSVKWFPAKKTGLIAGIVVSGFGLASVYSAPLANWLCATYGVQHTFLVLGIAFLIIVTVLAQFLRVPPPGFTPAVAATPGSATKPAAVRDNMQPMQMLATPQFYLLWFMFACGAGAGLMVIAKLAAIVKNQTGLNLGFLLVAVLAVGNGGGRIVAGIVSDKIGRQKTMLFFFIFQAVMIFLLSMAGKGTPLANIGILAGISFFIGANYGANLSLFPSVTKDYYGLKNFGVNYGLVFTSWGVGGFMLAFFVGKLYDKYHSFTYGYYGASVLLLMAAACTFLLKPPRAQKAASA